MASDPTFASLPSSQEESREKPSASKVKAVHVPRRGLESRRLFRIKVGNAAASDLNLPADVAEQTMLRDIDAGLARLETGIAAERAAMDVLMRRLTDRTA